MCLRVKEIAFQAVRGELTKANMKYQRDLDLHKAETLGACFKYLDYIVIFKEQSFPFKKLKEQSSHKLKSIGLNMHAGDVNAKNYNQIKVTCKL